MKSYLKTALTIGIINCAISTASAGSFQVWQQSAESLGDCAAGAAAIADDAVTAYYNSAGATRIKQQDMALSFVSDNYHARYKGTIMPASPITGFDTGPDRARGDRSNIWASLHYVAPISDKWGFALAISSPFQYRLHYGSRSFARYASTEMKFSTVDIAPSFAFRPFKNFSIGAGVNAQRILLDIKQVDTDTAIANDSVNKNAGDRWDWGWHAGMLWEITQNTRVGLNYQSKIFHKLRSKSSLSAPMSTTSRFYGRIELPAFATLSIYQQINPKWSIMGTVNYTQWSQFKTYQLTNIAGSSAPLIYTVNYDDSWLFAIGTHYRFNNKWIVRAGLGYDESPTRKKDRTISAPDADQTIVSIGGGYQLNEKMSFDVGYSHYFFKQADINNTQTYGQETITANGKFDMSRDRIGVQFNWLMT